MKYKNSPNYKGSLLWDTLPATTRCYLNITDYKDSLKVIFSKYNSKCLDTIYKTIPPECIRNV